MTLPELLPSVGGNVVVPCDRTLWPTTAVAGPGGTVTVGGVDLTGLAGRHGTPVQVLDTADVRARCRSYRAALGGTEVAYAAKAFLCRAMARTITEEGLSLDVCSAGEITVAVAAGVDPARMLLHGSAKTPEDIKTALDAGVGRIVIDSDDEIDTLADLAHPTQDVLLRVNPGIDAGAHPSLATGAEDSWFGFPLRTGAALDAACRIAATPRLRLVGLHCHLGSQLRRVGDFERAAALLVELRARIADETGVLVSALDLGGGHAVPTEPGGAVFDLHGFARRVRTAVALGCGRHGHPVPSLTVEPGRAIVARAGVTLYRVITVTTTAAGIRMVAVDGGMSDNPRPALYGARYQVRLIGRRGSAPAPATVVGRHCESGDVLARDVALPTDVRPGDLLAVPCTGAYHQSMASTYNMVGRSPVVAVVDGTERLIVRRETHDDLLRRDVG